jgi:hypothetical protein
MKFPGTGYCWQQILLLMLVVALTAGCGSSALASSKVMIEVDNLVEQDFVVVCKWYGNSLNPIHGAPLRTLKEKAFLAKAGEIVDCGRSLASLWPGSGVSVSVYHPLYVGTGGGESDIRKIKDGNGRDQEVIVVRPKLIRAWLDDVVGKYNGKLLSLELGMRYGSHLNEIKNGAYSQYYRDATGHSPDVGAFQSRYNDRLVHELQLAVSAEGAKDKPFIDAKGAIARLWIYMREHKNE